MGVLAGKAAIVTGSARGIGRAAAGLLAEHGARVPDRTSTRTWLARRRTRSVAEPRCSAAT